jgi:hypothetical protein
VAARFGGKDVGQGQVSGWLAKAELGRLLLPPSSERNSMRICRPACLPAHLQGVISQITPVNPSIFKLDKGAARSSFPPVLFVHMAQRDPEKAETVAEAMRICK